MASAQTVARASDALRTLRERFRETSAGTIALLDDLARQLKNRGNEAHALHQLGAVQAHADPPDIAQAEAYYQQALALAEELGMRPLQAHCHLGLGKLYRRIGRPGEARAESTAAVELYRSMEMSFWLPQAEAELAEIG